MILLLLVRIVIEALNNKYKIVEDFREAFQKNEFLEKVTDYFTEYDYIVGDYAYGKLRLKGFNNKNNKIFNKINDYSTVEKYIKTNCAYGCRYFILQKIND